MRGSCARAPWSVPRPLDVIVRPNSDFERMATSSHRPIALSSDTRLRSARSIWPRFSSRTAPTSLWVSKPPIWTKNAARSVCSAWLTFTSLATCFSWSAMPEPSNVSSCGSTMSARASPTTSERVRAASVSPAYVSPKTDADAGASTCEIIGPMLGSVSLTTPFLA